MGQLIQSSDNNIAEAEEVQYESLDFLVHEINIRCHWTVSPLQVAALLESLGITDTVAQQRYGYADVFVLANKIMGRLPRTYHETDENTNTAVNYVPRIEPDGWRETLRDYMRGLASLLPMVVLSTGIIVHQSIGNWQPYQVWMVGIAMLLSLLVTGGFMQAASRRGSIYLSQGYVSAAQRIIFRIMALCVVVVLAVDAVMTLLGVGTHLITWQDVALMSVAFISLSFVWLGASLLYLLDQAHLFLLALVVGVGGSGVVLLLYNYGPLSYDMVALTAVAVGMLLFMAVTAVAARYAFNHLSQASAVGNQMVRLPTNVHLTISLLPYFLYGSIYVMLIMSGHIATWVSNTAGNGRIVAIFDTELALAFALGGCILTSGVSEHTIRRFWKRVQVYQIRTEQDHLQSFGQMLKDFYNHEQRIFLLALLISSGVTMLAAWGFIRLMQVTGWLQLSWTSTTSILFVLGLIGYGLMAWALFQSMFMITLSRPWWVVQGLVVGTATTFIVGIAIGLYSYYPYAGLGIILGNAVFLYITRQRLHKLLERADYYFFASF